jgi:hypothetical protein
MKDDRQQRALRGEEASSTVIHHYEEDETLLARWLRKGVEQGPRFWLLFGGGVAVVVLVAVLFHNLSTSESSSAAGWSDLMLAKGVDDLKKLADTHADSSVAGWALLRAAELRFREGVDDLPNNRDAAAPLLKQALDLFEQAEQESPKDSAQKRMAALGVARTLEARDELDNAIKRYEALAAAHPGTDEGKRAEAQAKVLKDPASAQFYREFYAYKPKDVTLPPGGRDMFNLPGGLNIPGFPSRGPGLPGSSLPPALPPESPAGSTTVPGTKPRVGGGELPSDVFENPPPAVPKARGDAPAAKPVAEPAKPAAAPEAAPTPKS